MLGWDSLHVAEVASLMDAFPRVLFQDLHCWVTSN